MGNMREVIRFNLERYLSKSGYTQKEFAEKLGVSKSSVTNWVKGKNSPDVDLVVPICRLLNITISDFYSDSRASSSDHREKSSPSTDEAAPGENIPVILDKLNDLLVSEGFIRDGDDLTDRQVEVLLGVCKIIEATFND